jgi:hypothetical protein
LISISGLRIIELVARESPKNGNDRERVATLRGRLLTDGVTSMKRVSNLPHEVVEREHRRAVITRLRDHLIDWDLHVDDARRDMERAIQNLRSAVRERDRFAVQLAAAVAANEDQAA